MQRSLDLSENKEMQGSEIIFALPHTGTHPLHKVHLGGHLEVPQVQISTLGPCCQSGGMGGMPLQTGDPAVEGAGGTVEMIRG